MSGGFFFTSKKWLKEVVYSDYIVYKGEEDIMTLLSFLKGWNLKLASEATVWHNYNAKLKNPIDEPGAENPSTGEVYRKYNHNYFIKDKSVRLLNHYLFEYVHEKSLEDLEKYFDIKLKIPQTINIKNIKKRKSIKKQIFNKEDNDLIVTSSDVNKTVNINKTDTGHWAILLPKVRNFKKT